MFVDPSLSQMITDSDSISTNPTGKDWGARLVEVIKHLPHFYRGTITRRVANQS